MRVCFITNFIPPYRKTFYEKLCATPGLDWLVLRGRVDAETGRPDYRGPINAPIREVRNIECPMGPFSLRLQAGVLTEARAHRAETLVILGMAGNITNWLVLLWARLTGRHVLIWACGWEPQRAGSFSLWIKQKLMRVYFGMGHRCLLYSTKGRDYLQSFGVPAHKLVVCFNGIEIDDLLARETTLVEAGQALRQKLASPGEFVFLYVGGLLAEKRVDLLIDAFAAVHRKDRRVRLWIVGDGPQAAELRENAKGSAADAIAFLGRIVEGVDAYFSAADVFVLPGLGGLAFNQAMFWRTPCIGSQADGTEDDLVIDGDTGFRFDCGDPQSLQAAMLAAKSLPVGELEAMGERARARIVSRSNVTEMVRIFAASLRAIEARKSRSD